MGLISFFCMRLSDILRTIEEMISYPPQCVFLVSLSNIKWLKLDVLMFGTLRFVLLAPMAVFVPISCYCGSVIYLISRCTLCSTVPYLFRIILASWDLCDSLWSLECLLFLWGMRFGFWLGLHWICKYIFAELSFSQC